jgi:hypothetical protein
MVTISKRIHIDDIGRLGARHANHGALPKTVL